MATRRQPDRSTRTQQGVEPELSAEDRKLLDDLELESQNLTARDPAATSLEGIEFADEVSAPPPAPVLVSVPGIPPAERTVETMRADDAAAKEAFARLKLAKPQPAKKPVVVPPTAEEVKAREPKLYRVLVSKEVARGGSTYWLRAGKVISSNAYNIPELMKQLGPGVLEECTG